MCVVSMAGDYWRDRTVPEKYPQWEGWVYPSAPPAVTREEFDQLKRDIEELKLLIKAAKRYDEQVGEPACEVEDKVALIKAMAKAVGVDMEDLL